MINQSTAELICDIVVVWLSIYVSYSFDSNS